MTASRWLGLATLTLLFATSALAQEAATGAVGRWTTIDDETKKPKSVITIYEEGGKLFCLVEAPDPETAMRVHRKAHGLVADHL